jgi:type I restriction enzyme R subunit
MTALLPNAVFIGFTGTPLLKARAWLKARWGTMQKVLSSQLRLRKIADDIQLDMEVRDRLQSGRGNAMLVAGSVYEACKFYELFAKTPLAGMCAIVTSYAPTAASSKGEGSGEGATDALEKYNIYRQMLADWFDEPPEQAVNRAEDFEKAVKKKFIEEPGQMRLLIVVDKLLGRRHSTRQPSARSTTTSATTRRSLCEWTMPCAPPARTPGAATA